MLGLENDVHVHADQKWLIPPEEKPSKGKRMRSITQFEMNAFRKTQKRKFKNMKKLYI